MNKSIDERNKADLGAPDQTEAPTDFMLQEYHALREEILFHLKDNSEIEKVSLLSVGAIYAFLINFHVGVADNSVGYYIEVLLWWAPFFALIFARRKMGHHEHRLKQISTYIKMIEEYIYRQEGISLRENKTIKGWEHAIRGNRRATDWVMGGIEQLFWTIFVISTFVAALIKTSTALKQLDYFYLFFSKLQTAYGALTHY